MSVAYRFHISEGLGKGWTILLVRGVALEDLFGARMFFPTDKQA